MQCSLEHTLRNRAAEAELQKKQLRNQSKARLGEWRTPWGLH